MLVLFIKNKGQGIHFSGVSGKGFLKSLVKIINIIIMGVIFCSLRI